MVAVADPAAYTCVTADDMQTKWQLDREGEQNCLLETSMSNLGSVKLTDSIRLCLAMQGRNTQENAYLAMPCTLHLRWSAISGQVIWTLSCRSTRKILAQCINFWRPCSLCVALGCTLLHEIITTVDGCKALYTHAVCDLAPIVWRTQPPCCRTCCHLLPYVW